jgi:hypothetical protein
MITECSPVHLGMYVTASCAVFQIELEATGTCLRLAWSWPGHHDGLIQPLPVASRRSPVSHWQPECLNLRVSPQPDSEALSPPATSLDTSVVELEQTRSHGPVLV